MKYRLLSSIILAMVLSVPAGFVQAVPDDGLSKTVSTQMAVRDLWIDHIFWIRNVVFAAANGDGTAQAEADKQVVENARKIAGVIEPFYGKPASEKLFGLLAGHYGAVKDYLAATLPVSKDAERKAAVEKLTANAGEIAVFLSSANPNLPKDTLVSLLAAHGGHHINQINQIQQDDFSAEARTWAAMKQHVYTIADAMVGGIAKQFPGKF